MSDVILRTQHGDRRLTGDTTDSVEEVLRRAGVPLAAVWTYRLSPEDGHPVFVPSTALLGEQDGDVHARVNRNVDMLGLARLTPVPTQVVGLPVTEWTFPGAGGGAFEPARVQLSAEDCVDVVQAAVRHVLDEWPQSLTGGMVVGVSGGGDSNVLMTALLRPGRLAASDLHPVMLYTAEDQDVHLRNARAVCAELGCELRVIGPQEIAPLAGVRSVQLFFDEFERAYPDADVDFPWTWLLRRTLAAAARQQAIRCVAVGANREDLLSEGFLRLTHGFAPLPMPYRQIGDVTFVYPMGSVPKKIGDGAYPRRSLDNYEQRTPSISSGRSAFYQMAYLLADHLPGMDVSLLRGFEQLGSRAPGAEGQVAFDPDLDDHVVTGMATGAQRARWAEFLDRVRS